MSQNFAPRFETVSIQYFRDLKIRLSMQLFLLKSYQWSLNLKLSVMVMNCFCGMVYRRKAFSLISSQDHCQKFSPSRISDTPLAGFQPTQNRSSGLVEWNCAVVITTTPRSLFLVQPRFLLWIFPLIVLEYFFHESWISLKARSCNLFIWLLIFLLWHIPMSGQ